MESYAVSHPRKRALVIGINYAGTSDELDGCINDAHHIKAFLLSHGYHEKEIIMVLDDGTTPLKPTRKNILHQLELLVNSGAQYLFLSYSGHGSTKTDIFKPVQSRRKLQATYHPVNGDELDGQDESICAIDKDIIDDELRRIIEKTPATSQLFAIFDSCHSGTCLDLMCTITYNFKTQHLSATLNPHLEPTEAEICFISGCYDVQTSADTVEDGEAQGALNWSFLKSMSTLPKTASKRELIVDIITRLADKKYTQRPQISFGKNISIDDPLTL